MLFLAAVKLENKEKLMEQKKKKSKKSIGNAVVGFIFCLLALVGLISVVSSGYNFTKKILNDESQKTKFEKTILPILMLDPVPFDDAKTLDEMTVLRASLWTAIEEKRSSYSYDDMGYMLVPASDVEVAKTRLFGKDVSLKHQSFSEGLLIRYIYDEEHLLYRVPMDAQTGYYLPEVEEIAKNGDTYVLTVGYLPTSESFATSVKGKSKEVVPDKYMLYELKEENGYYRLVSIKQDEKHQITMSPMPEGPEEENRLTELPMEEGSSAPEILDEVIGG